MGKNTLTFQRGLEKWITLYIARENSGQQGICCQNFDYISVSVS